jgi:hypothetical protein
VVQRNSSKHSPRVDDELEHEVRSVLQGSPVEAHTRDDLQQEGPIPDPANRPDHPGTPPGFSEDAIDLRSIVAASLRPSAFPADRAGLLRVAYEEQAPAEVLRLLERLPDGVTWDRFEQVWETAGGPTEHRSWS